MITDHELNPALSSFQKDLRSEAKASLGKNPDSETWKLHFIAYLTRAPGADDVNLVFYDPFSPKTDTVLWQAEIFARLHQRCQPDPAELYTYASGTEVRVALLVAGFHVAEGIGTGPKATTTVAYSHLVGRATAPDAPRLLGAEWLARWRRSGAKFPAGLDESQQAALVQRIESHPQFASVT